MNCSLGQIILVASNSDGEYVFWVQMLVLVILATLVGIYGLVKTRARQFGDQEQDYAEGTLSSQTQPRWQSKALKELKGKGIGIFLKTAQLKKAITEEPVFDFDARDIASKEKPKNKLVKEREGDLDSGMEILEQDFLVRIVEKTEGDDKDDVMMRKLSFNELLRRGQLKVAGGNALKVYAMNEGNLYGKDIQCEAMKELAERTGLRPG